MTNEEKELILQFNVDMVNSCEEDIFHDGITCNKCHNRGYIAKTDGKSEWVEPCKCLKPRISLKHLRAQGLGEMLKKCDLNKFEHTKQFQEVMLRTARSYLAEPKGWFSIFGQSGCGKTFICTAIVKELILRDLCGVEYICWNQFIKQLNAVVNTEGYEVMMDVVKNADVLYIDDFLKPLGAENKPTTAELGKAFEILDSRAKSNYKTIISGERDISSILDIDQAIGGRIVEMSGKHFINISKDTSKNYRLKDMISL